VTKRTASVVLAGQTWLAIVSVVAITALAFKGVVDGAATVATILAITGVTSGTTRAVKSRVDSPAIPRPRAESEM
jgi:ABC-type dipeptide/oligopeptide/nickel transport system permease component